MLNNIYLSEKPDEAVYYQAIKRLNQTLTDAYTGRREPLNPNYIEAIKMMEDKSKHIFEAIDYRKQFSFYHSEMGQELLKFSYLTTFTKEDFCEEKMNDYLNEVKKASLWQTAQNIITHKIAKNTKGLNPINQHWLDLNLIRPKPKERMYRAYYEDDVKRGQYLNLYFNKEQYKR